MKFVNNSANNNELKAKYKHIEHSLDSIIYSSLLLL